MGSLIEEWTGIEVGKKRPQVKRCHRFGVFEIGMFDVVGNPI